MRPNLVLIIADDMAAEDCGPYGHPHIRTPNLDRLAREGMRFDRAFVTASSCSPSRASLITGRYPHSTDAEQLHWPLPAEQTTFVELLKKHGYWTAAAGKWHLGAAAKDRFDVVKEAGTAGYELPANAAQTGTTLDASGPVDDGSGATGWVPLLAGRPKDKPFFLWLASLDAHRDYKSNTLAQPHAASDAVIPPYLPDTPEVRADFARYYDEISRLDHNVGRVLDELDRQSVATNTFVLFLSDNGRPFPRAKTTLFDSGIRTPFLVRYPPLVKSGSICQRLVSTVDVAPTFLQLASISASTNFQGYSFIPLLQDPQQPIRQFVFAERHWHDFEAFGRAVRTERFKYIRNYYPDLPNTPPADAIRSATFRIMQRLRNIGQLNDAQYDCFIQPRPPEEFYDIQTDPFETNNLIRLPSIRWELRNARDELVKWQVVTRDIPPEVRTPDEFDRETGLPLPDRVRPRPSKRQLRAPRPAQSPSP